MWQAPHAQQDYPLLKGVNAASYTQKGTDMRTGFTPSQITAETGSKSNQGKKGTEQKPAVRCFELAVDEFDVVTQVTTLAPVKLACSITLPVFAWLMSSPDPPASRVRIG